MRSALVFTGTGLLVATCVLVAAALLPACGASGWIARSWGAWCPVALEPRRDIELAALTNTAADLQRRILDRERALAAIQCDRVDLPEAIATLPPPPPINERAWNARDIGVLQGCWTLESQFETTHQVTGETSRYTEWEMCFDTAGSGRERLQAQNGNSCEGPVTGRFLADGQLLIEEPSNLPCSDGGFIYRMRTACTLNPDGTALCRITQPEVGGATQVEFRRSQRDN